MIPRISPFRIITAIFLGLSISLAYSVLSSALLFFLDGKSELQLFLVAYNASFKTFLSLGLILGIAKVISMSQSVVPETIENAFGAAQLETTDYFHYKWRFLNRRRSTVFALDLALIGFLIFSLCKFPLWGLAEVLMIIPASVQYALAAYACHRLYSACRLIHSLLGVSITRNLLKGRELDEANAYVQTLSVLIGIFLCVHLLGYGGGPFLYEDVQGAVASAFLTLPPLIAAGVLLVLNLVVREVLRNLYERSIDAEEGKSQKVPSPKLRDDNVAIASKRFRVAFSFAGEKRSYVARVAALLATRFGEAVILYDKFHEAEFARRDLGFYLPDLYHKESDLVIVVVCPEYKEKEWCGLEWDAIFDLLKRRKNEDVMLCRFGRVLVRGLYSTAGFLELDDMSEGQAVARILERLALNEGRPKDYYLSGASPGLLPPPDGSGQVLAT